MSRIAGPMDLSGSRPAAPQCTQVDGSSRSPIHKILAECIGFVAHNRATLVVACRAFLDAAWWAWHFANIDH
eukprot:363171-Chlamydomonas_euryale.AAC.8